MLAVPMEVVGLVAWKIERALLRDLRLEILLVSLVCFNISEGFRVMMMILIKRARMAMTINSSIRVKLLVLFTPLDRFIRFFLKNLINLFCEAELSNGVRVKLFWWL
jgi:hypothetical protein